MTLVYNIFYNLAKFFARLFFSMRVVGAENMVESGPLILAVNHASYFDPPLAGICSRRAVYYLARKNLLEWPFFGPLFPDMNVIPVERDGNDLNALRIVIRKIKEGNGVVLFPEGTRSRDGRLGQARGGLGMVVAKTGAPVLPMRIFGSFEAFPRDAKLPRLLPITVAIGKPITFDPSELAGAGRDEYQKISERVMREIENLHP